MAKRFVTAREQFELLSPWRIAMPAPTPNGLSFQHHQDSSMMPTFKDVDGDDYTPDSPTVTAHLPGVSDPVGHISWYEPTERHPHLIPGEVADIDVHPDYRRRGIATSMYDWVKNNIRPELHHSDSYTDLGEKWIEHERTRYAQRTAMPWYHNTDAELNPGDELLPAAERGHESRWYGSEDEQYPNYDPHSVYMYNEHGNPDFYQGYGKNRYEVEPVGSVERDPEWDFNRREYAEWVAKGERVHPDDAYDLFDDSEVDGFADYTAPRARIIRKINPKKANLMTAAVTVYTKPNCPHQLSEQIFNGDGEPNEAHHGGWAEQSLERNKLTGKTFHVPSAYKDVDPSHPDRFSLTQKLQRQHSAEAEKYVNDVLAKNGWNRGPLTVKPEDWNTQQRGATASYAPGKLQIGLKGNHVTELTLLHEMAHALLDTTHDNYHGHEFKNQLHDLIHQNLGEEAGNVYGDIGFRDISPNQLALPLFKRDRTAAVHDQLMQIVAMADTTPWHPYIIEVNGTGRVRGNDKSYVLPEGAGKLSPSDIDPPLARLDVTIHNKGDQQWKASERPGEWGAYVPREHNEAYINSIVVHPDFQGRGIAQALIERLNKDYPEHKINPGVTTPKGFGLVQQLKKLIPGSEEKISPDYKPYVMDDGESAAYEKSEYENVGHEDYEYDDYTSEYKPPSRQLVNASYDDGPYWGAAWDDEEDDEEDDWPEGTVPKGRKHGNDLANAPAYVVDEDPYVGKHRKEKEPGKIKKWLKSWHPDQIALDLSKNKRVAMAWDEWAPHIQGGCDNCNYDKLFGGRGEYFIEHEKGDEDFHGFKKSTLDFYHDVNRDGQPQIYIQGIQTNPHYRNDGVAESLMRRLHEDHPDTHINTGIMTDDGEEFYERMLEKEPTARDFTSATRFWHAS